MPSLKPAGRRSTPTRNREPRTGAAIRAGLFLSARAKGGLNAHAGMRSFMQMPEGSIGFYLDFRSQEVGIAASRSDNSMLKADYLAGDIYHSLALMCGLTDDPDPVHWKKVNGGVRDRMKPLQLGINYGMGVPSLARGLNRHPLIASEIIQLHKRRYPASGSGVMTW